MWRWRTIRLDISVIQGTISWRIQMTSLSVTAVYGNLRTLNAYVRKCKIKYLYSNYQPFVVFFKLMSWNISRIQMTSLSVTVIYGNVRSMNAYLRKCQIQLPTIRHSFLIELKYRYCFWNTLHVSISKSLFQLSSIFHPF